MVEKYISVDLPLVSVVLATFDGQLFLEEQLQSIVNQSYKNIELVVQDDGSADHTLCILEKFKEIIDIRLEVNESRQGFVKNFERGLSRASGQYIALADQDDIWHPEKIEQLVISISNADLIHSDCSLIDSAGNLLKRSWKGALHNDLTVAELFFKNYVTGCTAMFKSELLLRALPFPDGIAYHDWWLAVCAATGNGIRYIEKPLISYRQHDNQDTGAGNTNVFAKILKRFRAVYGERRKSLASKHLQNLNAVRAHPDMDAFRDLLNTSIRFHNKLINGVIDSEYISLGFKCSSLLRPFEKFPKFKFLVKDIL